MLKNKVNVCVYAVFAFLVHGASDVGTDGISVKEGDSVTLHTDVTVTQQARIKWYFNNSRIAQIIGHNSRCTDVECEDADERFRHRLKLDNQTGSLTIMNITVTDSGDYKVTFSSRDRDKIFNISVNAQDEIKRKSVKEGESVTLDPDVVKNPNDVMWYFNDTLIIAEITGDQRKVCTDVQCKKRFRDRLKLDHQTGSLIIMNTRTTDSGNYKLLIKSSRNRYSVTSIMSFSVSVTDSGLSSDVRAGTCVAVVMMMAAAVVGLIYSHRRSSRKDKGAKEGHSRAVPHKTSYSAHPFHRHHSLLDKIDLESESEAE